MRHFRSKLSRTINLRQEYILMLSTLDNGVVDLRDRLAQKIIYDIKVSCFCLRDIS